MKNYLIIGASSGIGKKLADTLLDEGHAVYATYYQNPIESSSPHLHSVSLNVKIQTLPSSFLPDVLDGFVYCPGSINLKPFHRFSPEDFLEDYNLQVVSAIKQLQVCLSKLKLSGSSSILFFSTVAAQQGFNFHSQVSSSKGAIEGLTKALSAELAPTIRVNAIAPSLTRTPLAKRLLSSDDKIQSNAERHPLKKIGEAEDIANMSSFLLSDKAKWITGQVMHVDGGMSTIKN